MLDDMYLGQIEYGDVGIYESWWMDYLPFNGMSGIVIGNNIFVDPDWYLKDYSGDKMFKDQGFFMHELGHVWQDQNNPDYTFLSAGIEHLQEGSPYIEKDKFPITKDFSNLGFEEQADIFEWYFLGINSDEDQYASRISSISKLRSQALGLPVENTIDPSGSSKSYCR